MMQGAGKTHTLASMEADNVGMTPRALADIFNKAAVDVMHSYKVLLAGAPVIDSSPRLA